MESQHEMVLSYLKAHRDGMTSLDAVQMFGIMQMPKRIWILRRMGYDIESKTEVGTNRFGQTVKYVRYILKVEEK